MTQSSTPTTLSDLISPTENMFAGCLVATDKRPVGMLHQLTLMEMSPNWLLGEWPRTIFAAAIRASDQKWHVDPTPENLALIIQMEHLKPDIIPSPDPATQQAQLSEIASTILGYAALAETDQPGVLNSLAAAIRDAVATRRLMEYGRQATALVAGSMPATDKYNELAAGLEAARPESVEAKVYTLKDQMRIMKAMRKRQQSLLGRKLITCPPEWGLDEMIPYLLKGLLYTITALTGYGKSSEMTQWAEFLAICGWKVLYVHMEDDIERQINRTTRRMTGATSKELLAGDPRNQYTQVADSLKTIRDNSGGEVVYCWCPSVLPSTIAHVVKAHKADVVFIDYLQKIRIDPYLKMHAGNSASAWSAVVEDLKLIAENDTFPCVVIMGSQDAEHETAMKGQRKGTSNTRDAERKAQVVIEIERTRLTETDEEEKVGKVVLSGPGKLSVFARQNVVKNNDGETGPSPVGVFIGPTQTFKTKDHMQWEKDHPGETKPLPILKEPDEEYYRHHEERLKAYVDIAFVMDDPKTRRKKKSGDSASGPSLSGQSKEYKYEEDEQDVPF